MPDFRVYFIGDDGHIKGVHELANMTEPNAIEHAKQLLNGHDLEVWEGERHVANLSKKSD
jgi:hypothetical protein